MIGRATKQDLSDGLKPLPFILVLNRLGPRKNARYDPDMARIRTIEPGTQSIRAHSSEVDCFYNFVNDETGARLVHLSTFGSDHRKSSPKSSQSIQLDQQMAERLIAVLLESFPAIGAPTPTPIAEPPLPITQSSGSTLIYDQLSRELGPS